MLGNKACYPESRSGFKGAFAPLCRKRPAHTAEYVYYERKPYCFGNTQQRLAFS